MTTPSDHSTRTGAIQFQRPGIAAVMLMAGTMMAAPGLAQTPLTDQPVRLGWYETANMNPAGTITFYAGQMQTDPNGGGGGTGNQLYYGGGSYAVSDRLSFGVDLSSYQDPTIKPINGMNPDFVLNTAAFWAKYQIYEAGRISVAAQGSVESFLRLESPVFGGRYDNVIIGSVKVPVTVMVSERLQFHVTPGVSVFPDTNGGTPFYGTVASVGAGFSYMASERLSFYGAVDVPVSGNNTVTNTATLDQKAVWIGGARFAVTPKLALDTYVTNGVGITPATSILTHWPDGETPLFGVHLTWTPGAQFSDSFRGVPVDLTERQRDLQLDGFTLGSADTLEPWAFLASAWYGADQHAGGALSLGFDRDGQFDVIIEDYADAGTAPAKLVPTKAPRYMFGPKVRLMDQNNGDPLSLSGRLLFGRQIESGVPGVGVFYLEGMASYKVNDKLVLTANPKVAAFGGTEVAGVGLGVNYQVMDGLELIAEATAVGLDATSATWAAGARYNLPGKSGFSVDANVSNAIGRYGIGSMVAQDSPRYTIGLTKRFDVSGVGRLLGW